MTSHDTTTAPREIQVTRYVCPHCSRGHSKRDAATVHIARCWKNPALRGCKSCYFHIPAGGERGGCVPGDNCDCNVIYEDCGQGVDISGGPVTSCPQWKSTTDIEETA